MMLMPFEEEIEKIFGTVLNQIEKMQGDITKNTKKEISRDELEELGFSDDEINFLVFKKRLIIKYKAQLADNNIRDIIYEMPSDYYYKTILSNEKVKQLKRLKEIKDSD
jgi:hypothetical protein